MLTTYRNNISVKVYTAREFSNDFPYLSHAETPVSPLW